MKHFQPESTENEDKRRCRSQTCSSDLLFLRAAGRSLTKGWDSLKISPRKWLLKHKRALQYWRVPRQGFLTFCTITWWSPYKTSTCPVIWMALLLPPPMSLHTNVQLWSFENGCVYILSSDSRRYSTSFLTLQISTKSWACRIVGAFSLRGVSWVMIFFPFHIDSHFSLFCSNLFENCDQKAHKAIAYNLARRIFTF